MNILFVSSESMPYCKTGGLADVVFGMAKELNRQGHDTRIIIPCYRGILNREIMEKVVAGLRIPLGSYSREADIWKTNKDAKHLRFYLIQQEYYFGRDNYYGYLDDYERFIFFSRAVFELLCNSSFEKNESDWFPDIIQGYDWAVGLMPAWIPVYQKQKPAFSNLRFVLTIHNIGQMGIFGSRALRVAQQENNGIYSQIGEKPERINFLGRGMLHADKITTVKSENNFPESAKDLNILKHELLISKKLISIRNAIDYEEYNPSNDNLISQKYNETTIENRILNKINIQEEFKLKQGEHIPLLGMVTNFSTVKGFELLYEFKKQIIDTGKAQLIMLAEPGNEYYMALVRQWEKEDIDKNNSTRNIRIIYGFDEKIARRIYAGADIFLLPSKEEPCGIEQYIVMHYGGIPVVHATGALDESIIQWQAGMRYSDYKGQNKGLGFKFFKFDDNSLFAAVLEVIELFNTDRNSWRALQRHNMREDFSWANPSDKYLEIYTELKESKASTIIQGEPFTLERNTQLVQAILEIDSIPERDLRGMMQQAARLVREVLQCDAVYIWNIDEESSYYESLDRQYNNERRRPTEQEVSELLNHGKTVWRISSYLDRGGICRPIPNLFSSKIAEKENWIDGRTVPITAHGRIMGRIDTLFSKNIEQEDEELFVYSMTALANALGFRLETIRLSKQSDLILNTDRDLFLSLSSVTEVRRAIIKQAKLLSNGDNAWLYIRNGNNFETFEPSTSSPYGEQAARSVLETNNVVYIKDYNYHNTVNDTNYLLRSLIAIPIVLDDRIISIITVAKNKPASFSRDVENILTKYLAPQASIALQVAHLHEDRLINRAQQDEKRVIQLKNLADSLVVGGDFEQLLERIVNTTAEVLEASNASLFLYEKVTQKLVIKAAYGEHKRWLDEPASYKIGEGITGWLAECKTLYKADSDSELHNHPKWKGKYMRLQDKPPKSFLGIPLIVKGEIVGVMKIEDKKADLSSTSNAVFTNEDVQLGEMMANVIATVVYRTIVSNDQLQSLSRNLDALSKALAGGQEMNDLVNKIVKTISDVLGAEASSLYLIDEENNKLIIQAANGYQAPLVEKGAVYEIGEGVTGYIAKSGELVRANNLNELHNHEAWKGKQNKEQGGREPNSFLGLPLKIIDRFTNKTKVIGVLKVEDIVKSKNHPEDFFTKEDVLLVTMMANIIATVVYNTQVSNAQLRRLNGNLEELSKALSGGREMKNLVEQIVQTMSEVLGAEASSLYLIDDTLNKLVIQAATGYQKPLVEGEKKAAYSIGEGVTGWIAAKGKIFRANNYNELKKHSAWRGKQDDRQQGRLPNSFLGLPLKVEDRLTGEDKIIGVLKIEDIKPTKNHPENQFTEQDELLVTMMANIIATVVYNKQESDGQLQKLSKNLEELSKTLAGGQEIQDLVSRIVQTTARVLNAEASSLYLIDEATNKLVIQAATGYQEPLVKKRVSYALGEGITGWIAAKKELFRANNLEELHVHTPWKGKQNLKQGGREPNSFLGLPLIVIDRNTKDEILIGVLKIEDIIITEKHPDAFFTNQDVLLVTMMANVIATVIYNTRGGENRIGDILNELGSLSRPMNNSFKLLSHFVESKDAGSVDLIAKVIASKLDSSPGIQFEEAKALFSANANYSVFNRISLWTKNDQIKWVYSLFYSALNSNINVNTWDELFEIANPWIVLKEKQSQTNTKQIEAARNIFSNLAKIVQAEYNHHHSDPNSTWVGTVLDTNHIFGTSIEKLPVLLQLKGELDNDSLDRLHTYSQRGFNRPYQLLFLIIWSFEDMTERIENMRKRMEPHAIDIVVANIIDVINILFSSKPVDSFRSFIIRQISSISPFIIVGPVPDSMFFGREEELKTIIKYLGNKRSCAIIGGRRIGKTSILQRLFSVRLPDTGFYSLFLDCISIKNLKEFKSLPIYSIRPKSDEINASTLEGLLNSPPQDKPLILLLDETDALIKLDSKNNWELINYLRGLSNSGQVQLVFSGERVLDDFLKDSNSPFFNFANNLTLSTLKINEVLELVKTPLSQLDIEIKDEKAVIDKIYYITSGHPNVVQRLCRRLISLLNEQHKKIISTEDIDYIINQPEFQEEDFLNTFWERATPLEKIISLIMINNSEPFKLGQVVEILHQKGLHPTSKQVDDALNNLVKMRSILKKTTTGYEYKITSFCTVIANSITADDLLITLKEDFNTFYE